MPFDKPCRAILLSFAIICLAPTFLDAAVNHKTIATKSTHKPDKPHPETSAGGRLTESQRALHVLDRLAFGPRPGEVTRVMQMGVEKWIDQQLHPESIPDAALPARLNAYHTLRLSPGDLIAAFPSAGVIRTVADNKRPLPNENARRLLYQVQVAKYLKEKQKQSKDAKPLSAEEIAAQQQEQQNQARSIADGLLALPKASRMNALLSQASEQLINFPSLLRPDQRDKLTADFNPDEREFFYALNNPTGVVINEVQQAKILEAAISERQLQEVITDFWINHFNVFLNKDADQYYMATYERDVIRPHAFGKFKDLLVAVATSPAMLYYLDNWTSVGPNSQVGGGLAPNKTKGPARGLNENYGRELLELHTLGVDGGYSQKDVTEAARVLTGWTIDHPELAGGFQFDPRKHEPGDKNVMGKVISEDGQKEGLDLLDMLAHHPSTARFISRKLAQRFLSDNPPPALVEAMARTFHDTDGDIREVLVTLFKSRDFWAPRNFRAKVKTPFEFVISSIRASGATIDNPTSLLQALQRMGMPPYGMAPPTGYSMQAGAWINSDALLDRFNFAITLSSGKVGGIKIDPQKVFISTVLNEGLNPAASTTSGIDDSALSLMEDALLGGNISPQTQSSIHQQMNDPKLVGALSDNPAPGLAVMMGLILGSPEFQRR